MRVAVPVTQNFFAWLGGLNYLRTLLTALTEHGTGAIEPVLLVPRQRAQGALDAFPADLEVLETTLFDARRPTWAARTVLTRATGRDVALELLLRRKGIELLSHHAPLGTGARVPALSWVPDLQHRRLPDLFAPGELAARDRSLDLMDRHAAGIVVSSEAAAADVATALASSAGRVHVLRFVSDLRAAPDAAVVRAVLDHHGLGRYLYLPNQLWVHKNHRVVVEALGLLRADGRPLTVVATGDTVDPRDPGLARQLADRARELRVGEDFRLLGRIPYSEVGALMAAAVGVVNPSLFEGWSTTVEEARALGKRTVLSDIDVHREQNPPGAVFADPHDSSNFATALAEVWSDHDSRAEARRSEVAASEHPLRRRAFAHRYEDLCAQVTW